MQEKQFIWKAGSVIFVFSVIIWFLASFPRLEVKELNQNKTKLPHLSASIDAPVGAPTGEIHMPREELDQPKAPSQLEHSYLGRIGKAMVPFFTPLGYDWKITVAILSSFPAREILVSTLGIIYNIEDDSEDSVRLGARMREERDAQGKPVLYTIGSH